MDLDARKQRILQAVVEDYVATGEPVGSHILVQRYSLGVKSATIRNEMAEMSERGYLRQPHTSAGRVPSDRGYRFYVNRLMALPVVQEDEALRMRQAVAVASSEMEGILRKTCQLLTSMTRLPAVATPPAPSDMELRQIFVAPAGQDKTLLVLIYSTAQAESRVVSGLHLGASDALLLANALNERFAGKTVDSLRSAPCDQTPVPGELRRMEAAWARLCAEIARSSRTAGEAHDMFLEGAHVALEHPEFRDMERLGQFLSLLQEKAALIEMLSRALATPAAAGAGSAAAAENGPRGVHVTIGEESGRIDMAEYAVVTSPYYVGARESGAIGVLGPTRMDYARASAAVDLMARTVSELLTQLSVAP